MPVALITTDEDGNLTPTSTCAVYDGPGMEPVAERYVPPSNARKRANGYRTGLTPPRRIAAALRDMGYEPAVTDWDDVRMGTAGEDDQPCIWLDVRPTPRRINSRRELADLAAELGVRPDWHEPDEQDVTARVVGASFDNAGGRLPRGDDRGEMHVILSREGREVAAVNLATLLAWAADVDVKLAD